MSVLCGNGGLFLDFETGRGAGGTMTGYCFPEMLVELVEHARAGNRDHVHDLFDRHLPPICYAQQSGAGLAVRKYVLDRRGVLDGPTQRRPMTPLSAGHRQRWTSSSNACPGTTSGPRCSPPESEYPKRRTNMDTGLNGRTALVLGAGGLDGQVALDLAREGARVVALDRSAEALAAVVECAARRG
ncbi:hypothetical protein GCM10022222_59790 [Amycolatopsis ultiminotia]|uniref:Uncharacterized protein n=1 Tax=Amycolatopsis ultiminotia TaxID=543629 RepID=A0ABP6XKW2_9PSEU